MTNRVLFITSNQLKVFDWHGKKLAHSAEFKCNEEGMRDFEEYLKSSRARISNILLELLEEEFQRDTIPHVIGKDRQVLLERSIARLYRDNRYVFTKWIARGTEGRRDDEYLLTSISNPEPVELWLELLEKYHVPIAGIWSLPIISEDLLKKLPQKSQRVLLVSRQMRSTLRESYFSGGKLILSRQVRIEREIRRQRSAVSYLSAGIEQIYRFLSNQRFIQFGSTLDIYSLMPEDLYEEAVASFENTASLNYHFFNLDDVFKTFGIESDWEVEADTLFAFICSSKKRGRDHYLPREKTQSYVRHLLNKTIYYATTVGSVLLITLAGLLLVNSMEIEENSRQAKEVTQRLENYYNEVFLDVETQIDSAALVQHAVEFSERLKNEAQVSPEEFLIDLSHVYSEAAFSMIELQSFKWVKLRGTELEDLRRDVWRRTTPNLTEYMEYEYDEAELDDQVPVVTLTGVMEWEDLGYRPTVHIMESFINQLQALEQVQQLVVERTPVDIRVDSSFRDQTGTNYQLRVKSEDSRTYQILLLLKPSEYEDTAEVVLND